MQILSVAITRLIHASPCIYRILYFCRIFFFFCTRQRHLPSRCSGNNASGKRNAREGETYRVNCERSKITQTRSDQPYRTSATLTLRYGTFLRRERIYKRERFSLSLLLPLLPSPSLFIVSSGFLIGKIKLSSSLYHPYLNTNYTLKRVTVTRAITHRAERTRYGDGGGASDIARGEKGRIVKKRRMRILEGRLIVGVIGNCILPRIKLQDGGRERRPIAWH